MSLVNTKEMLKKAYKENYAVGYAAQSRSDAQTALLPKTQPAAPYAAETYTYPTKFMHNLCHIVM